MSFSPRLEGRKNKGGGKEREKKERKLIPVFHRKKKEGIKGKKKILVLLFLGEEGKKTIGNHGLFLLEKGGKKRNYRRYNRWEKKENWLLLLREKHGRTRSGTPNKEKGMTLSITEGEVWNFESDQTRGKKRRRHDRFGILLY